MKEVIFGCMGAEPNTTEGRTKGLNSKGKPERIPVYQRITRSENISAGVEPFHQQSSGTKKARSHSHLKSGTRRLPRETRPWYQPRQRSPLSRSRRPSSLGFFPADGETFFSVPPSRSVTGRYRSPLERDQGQLCRYRDEESSYDREAKAYERQYRRDLLRRQAAKLPLWEYTYEDGKPIRGILKNPKYIREPGLDEVCYVEVNLDFSQAFKQFGLYFATIMTTCILYVVLTCITDSLLSLAKLQNIH